MLRYIHRLRFIQFGGKPSAFSLQKSPKPSSQIGFPFTLVTWLKWPAWSDILPKIHWLSLAQQERRSSQRSRTKCPLAIYFIRMKVIFLSCNRILGKWFSMADDWRKFYKNCTVKSVLVVWCWVGGWKTEGTPNGPVNRIVTARNYEFLVPAEQYIRRIRSLRKQMNMCTLGNHNTIKDFSAIQLFFHFQLFFILHFIRISNVEKSCIDVEWHLL